LVAEFIVGAARKARSAKALYATLVSDDAIPDSPCVFPPF
jgi:hypothetical protein